MVSLTGCASKEPITSQTSQSTQTQGQQTQSVQPTKPDQPAQPAKTWSSPPAMQIYPKKPYHAIIHTNLGDISIKLFSENAPNTVNNFTFLARNAFYDGLKFHRVIKNFMIQTGDPLTKDTSKEMSWGTGGPGYTIKDELTGNEKYPFGTVAMANTGAPNSGGSQFFIISAAGGYPLPPSYTVFGKVTKGLDVVDKIQNVSTTGNEGTPPNKPQQDIIIQKVTVSE